MRGAPRCYYHLRPAKVDDFRLTNIHDPRERTRMVTEICNALFSHQMDPKRAAALLYAIQVADGPK